MLLLNPEAEPERQKEILERITKTADDGQGKIDKVEEWGKRRLAYEINHIRDAFYYVITLTAPTAALDEISHILRITDEVIRFMPVALKEKVASES